MDNKQKVYVEAVVAVTVLVVVWLVLRSRQGPVTTMPEGTLSGFQAPYFYTNPGIPDNTNVVNGGPTFNATNTINVNTGMINGLSNAYMPMFGLVGMTAVSG